MLGSWGMLIENADGIRDEISEILLLWELTAAFHSSSKEWKENQYRSRGRLNFKVLCLFVFKWTVCRNIMCQQDCLVKLSKPPFGTYINKKQIKPLHFYQRQCKGYVLIDPISKLHLTEDDSGCTSLPCPFPVG